MKRIVGALLGAGLAATASLAAELKIGFIYPSPIADVGWSKQLEVGREAIAANFGDRAVTTLVESVPEGPDAAPMMNQMVSDVAKFPMLGSFGCMNDGLKMARTRPMFRWFMPVDTSKAQIF